MRETVLVAFGSGGLGAAAGALLVLALHTPAPPPAAPAFDERALAAAFERALTKGVADLRRDLAGLRDVRAAGPAPAAEAAPRPIPVRDEREERRGRATRRRASAAPPDPEKDSPFDSPGAEPNYARLRKMHGWDERKDLRREWLFADEETCLSWFGTPDEVNDSGMWFYVEPMPDADGDGEPDGRFQYFIQFHEGRVFRIDAPDPDDK
jgi:hypothetical protein